MVSCRNIHVVTVKSPLSHCSFKSQYAQPTQYEPFGFVYTLSRGMRWWMYLLSCHRWYWIYFCLEDREIANERVLDMIDAGSFLRYHLAAAAAGEGDCLI